MFINLAHYLIPKIFFILSYIANPVFMYLIHTEKSFQFGSYKHLLCFFAVFNMIASLADILVPLGVHTYRYAIVVFTVDGPFADRSRFNDFLISFRCGFISGTYGILNAHFIYRFLSLRYKHIIAKYFKPYGLICSVLLVIIHWILWALNTDLGMGTSDDLRSYVNESFEEAYDASMENLNLKIAIFREFTPNVMYRACAAIAVMTFLSTYSVILYFVLGYEIMSSLNSGQMSLKTLQMQKRLFWALSIQTAIPICVSYTPCGFVIYGPAFGLNFSSWVNWSSVVAVSTFPFLDPFAIIMCLPALRQRLFLKFGIDLTKNTSNQILSIPRV